MKRLIEVGNAHSVSGGAGSRTRALRSKGASSGAILLLEGMVLTGPPSDFLSNGHGPWCAISETRFRARLERILKVTSKAEKIVT